MFRLESFAAGLGDSWSGWLGWLAGWWLAGLAGLAGWLAGLAGSWLAGRLAGKG